MRLRNLQLGRRLVHHHLPVYLRLAEPGIDNDDNDDNDNDDDFKHHDNDSGVLLRGRLRS